MPALYAGLGTEEVIDDFEIALISDLNDVIPDVNARYADRDAARAVRQGVDYEPFTVEPIAEFHSGYIPSFVQDGDRPGHYPLVAIVPSRFGPDTEDAGMDQVDVIANFIAVHVFAKATNLEPEDTAYRRAARISEAVFVVVRSNATLRRVLRGVSKVTGGQLSDPWLFPGGEDYGPDWCWQAVRTDYQIRNYTMAQ